MLKLKLALFVIMFALVASTPYVSSASITQESLDSCIKQIVPYTDWSKVKNPNFSLSLKTSSGGLLHYFGAYHSSDSAHAQFTAIESDWKSTKPTVAFYEGPNRGVGTTREETIQKYGESGFVRYLAAQDKIPTLSLEPSPIDEAAYVLQSFPLEQVKLFYFLRETSRLRERRKLTEPELRVEITKLLERASKIPGFGASISNLEELDAAYRRYWKTPANWWEAPSRWFDPLASSAETGGIFTNEINRAASHYRNIHMYKLLAQAAQKGERVFAVVGRNHVPMQEPALRCALK